MGLAIELNPWGQLEEISVQGNYINYFALMGFKKDINLYETSEEP